MDTLPFVDISMWLAMFLITEFALTNSMKPLYSGATSGCEVEVKSLIFDSYSFTPNAPVNIFFASEKPLVLCKAPKIAFLPIPYFGSCPEPICPFTIAGAYIFSSLSESSEASSSLTSASSSSFLSMFASNLARRFLRSSNSASFSEQSSSFKRSSSIPSASSLSLFLILLALFFKSFNKAIIIFSPMSVAFLLFLFMLLKILVF
ncbi:hypothetical protein ATPR_2687 [Acetobacter tropicalis NBRC 101654]|uniref:Uncharacterized protein n=1 Tax=Acetobacter tropicalis NBRC 101654 TaxID=749388 RepID=F7VH38_9PROT|nr:hypothetical protein ATPR_2687 [Acetobacter tropicalis NBRC 101654]